jgi:DNA polymerase-3 subunit gamma/tau
MALLLHEISLFQILNKTVDGSAFDRATITHLANKTTPEQIQLFYQIVLKGQEEINLAPDSKTGFEMTIIRLFAFKFGNPNSSKQTEPATVNSGNKVSGSSATQSQSPQQPIANSQSKNQSNDRISEVEDVANQESKQQNTQQFSLDEINNDNWQNIYSILPVKGMAKVLAKHAQVKNNKEGQLILSIDKEAEAFMTDKAQGKLCQALENLLKDPIKVRLQCGGNPNQTIQTIAKTEQSKQDETIRETKQQVNENPFVKHMQENFDAEVIQIKQGQNFLEV